MMNVETKKDDLDDSDKYFSSVFFSFFLGVFESEINLPDRKQGRCNLQTVSQQ